MFSSCKPVQLFVNMQIERVGKRKGFPHAVYSNSKYLMYFLYKIIKYKKVVKYHYDGSFMHEISKRILYQELGSSKEAAFV